MPALTETCPKTNVQNTTNKQSYVESEQAWDGGAYVDGETLQEAREAVDTVGELAETPEGGNGKAFST